MYENIAVKCSKFNKLARHTKEGKWNPIKYVKSFYSDKSLSDKPICCQLCFWKLSTFYGNNMDVVLATKLLCWTSRFCPNEWIYYEAGVSSDSRFIGLSLCERIRELEWGSLQGMRFYLHRTLWTGQVN